MHCGTLPAALLLLLMALDVRALGQPTPAPIPAVPLDATAAILEAFRLHQLVAIGDAHGNQQGEAFQLALIRDPRFAQIVNDILVEGGNSRHQDLVDRFVRGEDVTRKRFSASGSTRRSSSSPHYR